MDRVVCASDLKPAGVRAVSHNDERLVGNEPGVKTAFLMSPIPTKDLFDGPLHGAEVKVTCKREIFGNIGAQMNVRGQSISSLSWQALSCHQSSVAHRLDARAKHGFDGA